MGGLRVIPSTAGSERPLTPIDYSMPDLALEKAKNSVLVQLYEARKAATEAALGQTFDCPKPRVRLSNARPRTPSSDDTVAWREAVSKLEKPAIINVLHKLQHKLDQERRERKSLENGL